ncbi:MAG TPA: ankyrin repeat domain-containing protein [Vicinamibacterales bacterium]|nr:ankyrin repeat domain-containing protein [Vicinamibacterales bacterium]
MRSLPSRPSIEQLRKQAKDLARDKGIRLSDAQRLLAREYGFTRWDRLLAHVRGARTGAALTAALIRPVELRPGRPYALPDGTTVTTDDVYATFVAARAGDLAGMKRLIARAPGLAIVEYNYTPPIHFAAREGHRRIVELLIARGADLAYRSYPFADSLLTIAEDHQHAEVADLVRRHLATRFRVADGTRVIIDAARDGDLSGVQAEIARDAALAAAANETGDTALHHAARRRSMEMVRMLLDAGADADAIRGDGYRPIHLALMTGSAAGAPSPEGRAIADLLLARGARYTMFLAALLGDAAFVRRSLARDRAMANDEDTNHHRPISGAVRRGDLELARLLLEHGADPALPEEGAPRGHALWAAAYADRADLAELLLRHGADPNGMVESSGTPMMIARGKPALLALLRAHGGIESRGRHDDIGRAVIERRFDVAERLIAADPAILNDEEWGDGILAGPANAGAHDVLAFLIRLGARVPPVSKWAPYYYFKHEATAAFLLERGMDPNHMNWHRLTLLHHMAAEGEMGKARLLLDHGAAIDAVDEEYRSTPLGVAARRGQLAMVDLLLSRGADAARAGMPWATPLAWAQRKGHAAVAARLERP